MGGAVNTLRDTQHRIQKQVCLVPRPLPHREAPVLWSFGGQGYVSPLFTEHSSSSIGKEER